MNIKELLIFAKLWNNLQYHSHSDTNCKSGIPKITTSFTKFNFGFPRLPSILIFCWIVLLNSLKAFILTIIVYFSEGIQIKNHLYICMRLFWKVTYAHRAPSGPLQLVSGTMLTFPAMTTFTGYRRLDTPLEPLCPDPLLGLCHLNMIDYQCG